MAKVVIPGAQQRPGELVGGFWVVMQSWPVANRFTLALLGPEGARITNQGGQWNTLAVPRGVGITEYTGRRNFEMTVDLLYDGWLIHPLRPDPPPAFIGRPNLPLGVAHSPGRGLWIEQALANLEDLTEVAAGDVTPPSVRIYGAVPHAELRWVIQALEWGDTIRDKVTGRRMRQQVTVNLLEYNQPTDLQKLPRARAQIGKW